MPNAPVVMLVANTSWYLYNFRRSLVTEMIKKGYTVVICAPYDNYSKKLSDIGAQFENININQRGTSFITEIISILCIRKTIQKFQPDYLFSYTPKGNLYSALVKHKNTTQIANISGLGEGFENKSLLAYVLKILFKLALKNASTVFFQNQEDLDYFVNNKIVSISKVIRIYGSGVNIQHFKPSSKNSMSKKYIFLTLGRIIPQKGYPLLLELISSYPGILKKAEFHILGIPDYCRSASIDLYNKLKTAAQNDTIILHEPVDDVAPFICAADCIVLPSTYNEGVPRSLIEGLACGKPIITTDWKGCRDTVIDGKNGFLVEPYSVQDLHEKICNFCDLSDADHASFSTTSRKLAEEKYDEQKIINTYLTIISKK